MYWLEEHLEDGSFKTCYADTDSMALALTKSGPESDDPELSLRSLFDPIVKPSMRESWEASWKTWFVTTDEIWDIRKPGKLKGKLRLKLNNFWTILVEFQFRHGRFIALSPKTYHAINTATKDVKAGLKGVSHAAAKNITLEDFLKCLYDDVVPNVVSRELRKNKHEQIVYNETIKRGLNPVFKKFRVQSDRISCLPLTKNGKIL